MPTDRALTPDERRQRNHDEVASLILQAARAVMREQGVADLNLQEVARRVGMRAPSLYNYFPNRHAIYDALFAQGMRMYRERLEQIAADAHASWDGLERVMRGYLDFALENPDLYQLLFERPIPGFAPSGDGLVESARLLTLGGRLAEAWIASGAITPGISPDATANLVIALMHGITAQHLANEPQLPAGEGRFGSLIPVIVAILKQAWTPAPPRPANR